MDRGSARKPWYRRCVTASLASDLVGAVVFLVDDESAFVTGQLIVVDGGALMR